MKVIGKCQEYCLQKWEDDEDNFLDVYGTLARQRKHHGELNQRPSIFQFDALPAGLELGENSLEKGEGGEKRGGQSMT